MLGSDLHIRTISEMGRGILALMPIAETCRGERDSTHAIYSTNEVSLISIKSLKVLFERLVIYQASIIIL